MEMILTLAGALGVFLYGMRLMSDSIQKTAGNRLQGIMNFVTGNRFAAVTTGFGITSLVQSSSATTVLVVSFVNAGLLTLTQSIGVIMGANIGTTVTTWIVSAIGFKFKISAFALPIIGVGFPMILAGKHKWKEIGGVLVGFGLLFLGLSLLKESVPDIKNHPEMLEFLKNYTGYGFWSYLLFVGVGTILTVVVQSSSAAMAITVTMAYSGWIDYPTAAAIVLGENIGTTITAYLASLGTKQAARQAARAHMLFNLLGVVWISFIFKYFTHAIETIGWGSQEQSNIPLNLSLFHTSFNIINTLVFLPFVNQFAKLVKKLVKPKKIDKTQNYTFEFISTNFQSTPQLNILKVKQEIEKMADVVTEMFSILDKVNAEPFKKMHKEAEKLKDLEELTDCMKEEISKFLVACFNQELTETQNQNINQLMRIVNELENVADSSYNLMLLAKRRNEKRIELSKESDNQIKQISDQIKSFLNFNLEHLNEHLKKQELEIAQKLEDAINELRNKFSKSARKRLQDGSDVKAELHFLDMIKHLEHIGDHSINIAEALRVYR